MNIKKEKKYCSRNERMGTFMTFSPRLWRGSKSKAFTLIEILITLAIIAMMTVIAIPTFSNYGEKADFSQKMDQVQELINKTIIQSQNPTQGNNGAEALIYFQNPNNNGVYLYDRKIADDGSSVSNSPIKEALYLPSYYTMSSPIGTSNSLVCKNTFANCCINDIGIFYNNGNVGGTAPNICYDGSGVSPSTGWFKVTDTKSGQVATFIKLDNPTRVSHSIP